MTRKFIITFMCLTQLALAQEAEEYINLSKYLKADTSLHCQEVKVLLFPDSGMVFLRDSVEESVSSHIPVVQSIGISLDVKQPFWKEPFLGDSLKQNFDPPYIDSLFLAYSYRRQTSAKIIDTLIVQFFKEPSKRENHENFLEFDTINQIGYSNGYSELIKIPLDTYDSTVNNKRKFLYIDKSSNWVATYYPVFTVQFKPGYQYQAGDTILHTDSSKMQFNAFSIVGLQCKKTKKSAYAYNHGLWVKANEKPAWYSKSEINDSLVIYPIMNFKVFRTFKSIDSRKKPKIAIYPNPLSANQTFIIRAKEPFTYRLYNTMGSLLKEQTALPNENISVGNLQAGSYFLEIHTDSGVFTQKILVLR